MEKMKPQATLTDGSPLLDALMRAVRPLIQSPPALGERVAGPTIAVIVPSPLTVYVQHQDVNGTVVNSYRVPGTPAIAEAFGELVTTGLNEVVTVDVRRRVAKLVDQGAMLMVRVDVDHGAATVLIASETRCVILFALATRVVAH